MGLFYCDPDEDCLDPQQIEDETIDVVESEVTDPEELTIIPPSCIFFGEDGRDFVGDDCVLPPLPPILPPLPRVVPLKEVFVEASIDSSCALATIDFRMTYINPGDKPILTTYEFPLDQDTVLSALTIVTAD